MQLADLVMHCNHFLCR